MQFDSAIFNKLGIDVLTKTLNALIGSIICPVSKRCFAVDDVGLELTVNGKFNKRFPNHFGICFFYSGLKISVCSSHIKVTATPNELVNTM